MQHRFRSFVAVGLAAVGVGLVATSIAGRAKADAWDKMTYVTIHERIIAGNKVLEPGTYVWKLVDSPSDRHVVQIFNRDQTHLEETILAIPNYRLQPTGESRFAFWETPAGVPKAVRAWFYPGDNFGQEFKYPKALVAQLASEAPVPVPVAYREPEPAPAPAQPTAQPGPQPEPQPVAAEPAPQPAPQAAPNPAPAPSEPSALPHTASNLPLIGLLGMAFLGLAGILSLAKQS
jgi:hypothetical protein